MTFNIVILRAAKDLLFQSNEQQIPRALRAHRMTHGDRAHRMTGGANG